MTITADDLTDEMIRAEVDRVVARFERGTETRADLELHAICKSALNPQCNEQRKREARERIAAAINARSSRRCHCHEWPRRRLMADGHRPDCIARKEPDRGAR